MKKSIVLILLLSLSVFSTTTVNANSAAPQTGITVMIENGVCTEFTETEKCYEGNIDILVNINDVSDNKILEGTKVTYVQEFPNYQTIDYLTSSGDEWVSYRAHYNKDVSLQYDEIEFEDSIIDRISMFKLVYFDDDGTTLFISETLLIDYDDSDSSPRYTGIVMFNTETFEIYNDIGANSGYGPNVILFFIIALLGFFLIGPFVYTFFFVIVSVCTEFLVALFFKFKPKIGFLAIVIVLNLFTQFAMYLFFDSSSLSYFLRILISEPLIYGFEYLILYLIFKKEPKKKILYFVLIANTLSLLIGLILNSIMGNVL